MHNLVTPDMLIGQAGELEQFHWFVRAHPRCTAGSLTTEGSDTERDAAERDAAEQARR